MKSAVLMLGIVFVIAAGGCSSSGSGSEQANAQGQASQSAAPSDNEYVATDAKGIQTITVRCV